jgi:hypothetical protein
MVKIKGRSDLSKYYTNKDVKKKIDDLLCQNARNVANFETGGMYDLKTKENFNEAWSDIEFKIKELDEAFYKVIKKHKDND